MELIVKERRGAPELIEVGCSLAETAVEKALENEYPKKSERVLAVNFEAGAHFKLVKSGIKILAAIKKQIPDYSPNTIIITASESEKREAIKIEFRSFETLVKGV